MTKIIKIDRVKSVGEAKAIERAGANFISVSLAKDSKFDDDRTVNIDTAISIKEALKSSTYVGEVKFNSNLSEFIELVEKAGFDFVQLGYDIPPLEVRRALEEKNIGIIYANIEASHDDDPSWILSRFIKEEGLNVAYFQIDLLPEYQNSWDFLKNKSPEYPEELQIEDINELGEEIPLFITIDYSVFNVVEILSHMPTIKGISMILGDASSRDDIHYFHYFTVLEILNELKDRRDF